MLGGVVWIAFVAMRVPHWLEGAWALALLLFAALVLVPLALELATEQNDPDSVKVLVALTRLGQLPAALLLMWACTMPAGGWAVLVAVPWVIVRDGEGVAELQALPPGTRRARVRVERDLVLDSDRATAALEALGLAAGTGSTAPAARAGELYAVLDKIR